MSQTTAFSSPKANITYSVLMVGMTLLLQVSALSAQIIQGNPGRRDMSMYGFVQRMNEHDIAGNGLMLTYNDTWSAYIQYGQGDKRSFDLVGEEVVARTSNLGSGVSIEVPSYRAGKIHWELMLGYEQAELMGIDTTSIYPEVTIKMVNSSISAVWDVERKHGGDFTRLGIKVTGMFPRSHNLVDRYHNDLYAKRETLQMHDITSITANLHSTLPWIRFSMLSLDVEAGTMQTNTQWEPLLRLGMSVGFDIFGSE